VAGVLLHPIRLWDAEAIIPSLPGWNPFGGQVPHPSPAAEKQVFPRVAGLVPIDYFGRLQPLIMQRLLSLFTAFAPIALCAQVAINPQIGITLATLTPAQVGVQYKANVGVLAGADLRIGERFYLQPGAFFVSSKTAVSVGDSLVTEDHLVWNSLKLKALAGYNLLDGDDFRLRIIAGPTYNWLLSATGKDDHIKVEMKDFNTGTWGVDAGLGIDLTIFTVQGGVNYGLSKAYKSQEGNTNDVRFITYYVTVGVVLGGSTAK
jgi:hypothetical protein